jgi:hypothetical protein
MRAIQLTHSFRHRPVRDRDWPFRINPHYVEQRLSFDARDRVCPTGGRVTKPDAAALHHMQVIGTRDRVAGTATLATLAQVSTLSAAHFLKSHQILVQNLAADRNRQKGPQIASGPYLRFPDLRDSDASTLRTSDWEIPNCLAIRVGVIPALKVARTALTWPCVNATLGSSGCRRSGDSSVVVVA